MRSSRFQYIIILIFLVLSPVYLKAQTRQDTLPPVVTLQECLRYALKNQPLLKQANIDQDINERNIDIALSAWLPQVNGTGNYQHYFQLASTPIFNSTTNTTVVTQLGIKNTSTIGLGASQTIFNNDVLLAKQATISLNNELSARKQTQEAIKANIATLKEYIGSADNRTINPVYDSLALAREIAVDTNVVVNPANRIEYQLLESTRSIQNLNIGYYKYGFLPSLSAFGNYNLSYLNNSLGALYNQAYPNSYAGLSLSIPIFQGTRRLQNLRRAKLIVERADLDLTNSRNAINTEYVSALANYKSNYTELLAQKENVSLANEVYNVVFLQYREGIKTYLDVIVAQSDLRTSQINYNNALFTVLSSKVDLQRALGTLPVNY
ncbi:MAG: TolC family protein [Sphingobacteriaceae bacterium]|nr:MAG: TolC family protein [Sphingobacteriaceae bacterium]